MKFGALLLAASVMASAVCALAWALGGGWRNDQPDAHPEWPASLSEIVNVHSGGEIEQFVIHDEAKQSRVPKDAGPQVQRLEYRIAREKEMPFSGLRYAALALEAAPLEGVELPKLSGGEPLFGKWLTPMVPAGRLWLMLCRSGKDNVYDRLYVDADADGSLADEKAVEAHSAGFSPTAHHASFGPVEVRFPGPDGPVVYHFNLYFLDEGGRRVAYVSCGGWYEGPVTVGGESLWCTLVDRSGNGRFNDVSMDRNGCDSIRLGRKGDRAYAWYELDPDTRYVGRYIEVAGTVYAMAIPPGGGSVAFTPAPDVPRGTIRVADGVARFSVWGEQGFFFCRPVDGAARVPAGTYRVYQWEAVRKDAAGTAWQLLGADAVKQAPLAVEAGREARLDIGESVESRLTSSASEGVHLLTQEILSAQGDNLILSRDDGPPPDPRATVRNADGSYNQTFRMAWG